MSVPTMSVQRLQDRAIHLMEKHGLDTGLWRVRIDRAKTRAGLCDEARRCISLSRYLVDSTASEADMDNIILHEIAHALVGNVHGHNAVWRAKAIEIGCDGARCHTHVLVPAPYAIKCPCGAVHVPRHNLRGICKRYQASRCKLCHGELTLYQT
jgi:predicted SprT family Zn-dependent metalloprotease